jgi:hypothetical protein
VSAERDFGACLERECAKDCIPPRWACLEHPAPPSGTGTPFRITYRLFDYELQRRVEGLTVRACDRSQQTCGKAIAQGRPTSAAGETELQFDGDPFDGYAEISGPGYMTVLLFLPKLATNFVANAAVIRTETFAGLASEVAAPNGPNPARGTLVAGISDCLHGGAGGVHLGIDLPDGSVPFYLAGPLPSPTATATVDDPDTSYGGFLDVRPGTITLSAKVVENGLDYTPAPVFVRPGTDVFTEVLLFAGLGK